ncbi:MAG: cupin domain-containing protein [Proteobacteria bacterium]|nr:cupin domain-containing protein [Pseudomonadota bacterium]
MTTIHKAKADIKDISALITKTLPNQGCIEVQRDVPRKEHVWHQHKVDETIVVLDGSLRFYWSEGECLCFPGDVISLPAGSPHGSEALDDGATYLIAFHNVSLS